MGRWIKLYFKLLEWEWHDSPEMLSLFIHLLLCANSAEKRWHGIEIPRGSLITSYRKLSVLTGIAKTTLFRCMQKLIKSGEIVVKAEHLNIMVSICNYEIYQAKINEDGTQMEQNRDTSGTQMELNRDTSGTQMELNIDNKNIQDLKENKEIKDSFLKNGKAAEKKVFKIEEIKAALAAEGIYMTENGYVEFKALNEGENGYGYKGGIIRSAQIFLQKPMNQKYSLARENNGNGKGKGKNTPPTLPPPPDPATVQLWETVKADLKEQISTKDFNTWIRPITPLKVVGDTLTIIVPSDFFQEYIEDNLITYLQTALNKLNIINLIYTIIKN